MLSPVPRFDLAKNLAGAKKPRRGRGNAVIPLGFFSDNSIVGGLLHTLIGYTDRPTAAQFVAYLMTIMIIVVLDAAPALASAIRHVWYGSLADITARSPHVEFSSNC
jgi:hypothetical protein